MAQFFRYPADSAASSNPSVAPDGGPIPGSATVVAGENPSGNVQVLQTDSSGALLVSPLTTSSTVNARLQDGAGNPITSQVNGAQRALDVGIDVAGVQVDPRQIRALTSSDTVTVVQPTGTNLHTVVDSSALPTGASTSALQTQISGQLPTTLGQKTSANSLAVVVASDQSSIPVTATLSPGGTVTANQGTAAALAGAWPVEITDGTNVLGTSTNPVRVDPTGTTTQPISAASLPLPTGASTSANQTTANSALTAIQANQTNGTQTSVVTQPTGTNLHTVVDSGTITVTQATGTNLHAVIDSGTITLSGTSPVSGTVTANQGTANATPWNENIAQFGGTNVSLGSKVSASSMPVVIASDQGAVPASQSGTWNINNVSGTVSLPTGASTSALQTTGNTSLSTIATNQTSGGQKTQLSTPTALTVTNAAITVGTTAVRLTVSGSAPASTRVVLVATPDTASTATFYIGTSTVTNSGATRGIEIKAGQSFIANNDAGDYWIVASAASQTVTVMEQA